MRFKDLASAEFPIPEHEENKIINIALPIGKDVLMGNDVLSFDPDKQGTDPNKKRGNKYNDPFLPSVLFPSGMEHICIYTLPHHAGIE